MKAKSILTFIAGIVTGVILTFIVSYCKVTSDDLMFFDQPGEVMKSGAFKVTQVLHDGSALAWSQDEHGSFLGGVIVLLSPQKGKAYYDDQKVSVPTGKCARQVGTFRYMTKGNTEKTVPVVDFFAK